MGGRIKLESLVGFPRKTHEAYEGHKERMNENEISEKIIGL